MAKKTKTLSRASLFYLKLWAQEPLMTCYPDMDWVTGMAHNTCHQINMHSATYTRLVNFNGKTLLDKVLSACLSYDKFPKPPKPPNVCQGNVPSKVTSIGFPNDIKLSYMMRITGSGLICSQGQEVTNAFYHMPLVPYEKIY
ncbi:hypothetical protein VNO80_26818 [Phaseolus coccineus]|uniref:Uncharacterized protein n=1 Tax=Phaseolus coccineus TaxID=3886 RepID=A0AAN9LKI4_PHACN